jgi:hypothetical protein
VVGVDRDLANSVALEASPDLRRFAAPEFVRSHTVLCTDVEQAVVHVN